MQQGWIKIHRQFLDWEWYDDNNTKIVFLHLLLKANHKAKKYRGMELKAGSILTGRDLLSFQTGLSVMQIRTALTKLKSTNEITTKTSSQGSIIQIVNYTKYQIVTNELTKEQPTSNQQVTTNKNVKNVKNDIKERKAEFKKLLAKYKDVYVLEMIKDFYEYWTEHSPNDKKLRFEKQTSFDVNRRLKTWLKNSKQTYTSKNYKPPTYGN
tara:strand:- start:444 stop:1073 length:630 start_codon:yes stop_codon:yes gene_type:complete